MTRLEIYLNNLQRFGIHPGLERIRALLGRVENPQCEYPVVLVGGTNGKGSTCEFLAQQLAVTKRRVGLYTSPHLYRWNERIRVLEPDSEAPGELFAGAISDAQLDTLFEEALPHLEAVVEQWGQPTEFETMTFLGLWHFARSAVDVAVVEVGLGGKWDATNVTEPAVSVITHVALDHCQHLGNSLQEIARDKVEIARAGRVLVTAETKPPVLQVFQEYAAAHAVKLWPLRAPDWTNDPANLQACSSQITNEGDEANDEARLSFQQINWLTASIAKRALESALNWPSWEAPHETLPQSQVPGRTEVLRDYPVLLIDGANNPDGAAHLATHLRAQLDARPAAGLILVLGILADKDYAAMVAQLAPLAHVVIATQSPSPRAAPAEVIAAEARQYCAHVETVATVPAAVERALEIARRDDIICVTGSFYTIAQVDRDAVAAWTNTSFGGALI